MIDINKKYTLRNGKEVHLYDIVGDMVFGRYYNPGSAVWVPEKWCAHSGLCYTQYPQKVLDLVEVPTFKIEQIIVREMKRQNYLGFDLYVPSTVNYIAVDNDGKIYGYQTEPQCGTTSDILVPNIFHPQNHNPRVYLGKCEYSGDWTNSLVKLQ